MPGAPIPEGLAGPGVERAERGGGLRRVAQRGRTPPSWRATHLPRPFCPIQDQPGEQLAIVSARRPSRPGCPRVRVRLCAGHHVVHVPALHYTNECVILSRRRALRACGCGAGPARRRCPVGEDPGRRVLHRGRRRGASGQHVAALAPPGPADRLRGTGSGAVPACPVGLLGRVDRRRRATRPCNPRPSIRRCILAGWAAAWALGGR